MSPFPEDRTQEYGLGRLTKEDARDHRFPMREMVSEPPPDRTFRYWNPLGWWGNQRATPQCVAYAWIHWLEDGPITRPETPHGGTQPVLDPTQTYRQCQEVDEWPGTDYDGTSVRAGAKVLQSKGFIAEYRWAWDIETVVKAILTTGPVVVGTWWYASMFYPDGEGYVQVEGNRAGGHAYILNGVNTRTGIVRGKNSWGRSWGKDGYFYLSLSDMDRLIREQGEACMAVEIPSDA